MGILKLSMANVLLSEQSDHHDITWQIIGQKNYTLMLCFKADIL